MSMMEQIVRPFAQVSILPAALPMRETATGSNIVAVSLGGSGGTTVTFQLDGGSSVIDDNNSFKESGRSSTKVHVANEDDPDQFVEFCRADKVTLTPKRKDSAKPRTSSYDLSGGYHDLTGNQSSNAKGSGNLEYSFQYPKDTTCQSPAKPKKGC